MAFLKSAAQNAFGPDCPGQMFVAVMLSVGITGLQSQGES